nr:hypothetical protein [Candidatus Gracilibacteria bacterium]
MITAKEAGELLKNMTQEDRFNALKNEVSEKTRNAIDNEVRKAVAACKNKVEITLGEKICRDPDDKIHDLVVGLGYKDVKVTSDFPCGRGGDSYEGKTFIKFTIPQ